ncbi:hypothetical protein B0H10DRAFT_2074334 [Mycena sp. CBHHK59/15]|nr:hypothetical protein B0H10DRAFT_2074334 [Mycena sp. CBHHK59/15]
MSVRCRCHQRAGDRFPGYRDIPSRSLIARARFFRRIMYALGASIGSAFDALSRTSSRVHFISTPY